MLQDILRFAIYACPNYLPNLRIETKIHLVVVWFIAMYIGFIGLWSILVEVDAIYDYLLVATVEKSL